MLRRKFIFTLVPAVILAACSTDLVAPAKTVSAPSFAISSAQSESYLVLMKGNAIPNGFATKVANFGGTVTYSNAHAGFALISGISPGAATQLAAVSGVVDIQSDQEVALQTPLHAAEADISAVGDPSIDSQSAPNTAALFGWQWNMRLIGADGAWAAGMVGSSDVTVAIIDSGIDYDDRDLNGLVDLARSASFSASDNALAAGLFPTRNAISDFNGHGTNVASQVSSKAVIFAGVTSLTRLIGVKVLGAQGSGTLGQILAGIVFAADQGADVANLSIGAVGGGFSKAGNGRFVALINRVFNYAKAKGMLMVVAAGNEGIDLQHDGNLFATYCDAPHVVCVSSIGPRVPSTSEAELNQPAFYTSFGRPVDVAAPGGNAAFDASGNLIVSNWPWGADIASWVWSFCAKTRLTFDASGNPHLTSCAAGNRISGFIGTSQATPHVAGLAALLVVKYGKGRPQTIKNAIERSAISTNAFFSLDPVYGRGRISVTNALGL
jgi:subtilisin family serine protease